ncbi:hypothetical protein ACKKBG_A33825 [Auxenochlorella protothecoides x Auxenochlorella symbiontica]
MPVGQSIRTSPPCVGPHGASLSHSFGIRQGLPVKWMASYPTTKPASPPGTIRVHAAHGRLRHVCMAGNSSQQQTASNLDVPVVPASQDEAIEQACDALAARLSGSSSTGFDGLNRIRLSLEIPLADTSPSAQGALVSALISGLTRRGLPRPTPVGCSSSTASLSRGLTLEGALKRPGKGPVLIVAPSAAQAGQVARLLHAWGGGPVLMLNAEWEMEGGGPSSPETRQDLRFDAVYVFMPLNIKALVTRKDGIVMRSAGRAGAPWRILLLAKGKWEPIASMAQRPTSSDIETSLYNYTAATSPLTKGISAVRNLFNKRQ